MSFNIEIDNTTLDILSTRLKKVTSPLDILKWLGNFKPSEVELAIDIISNMTVYTTNEIEEILNDSFQSIFPNISKNERIIVNPIGDFGKSGSMITYFFQKTSFYKNRKNQGKTKLLASVDKIDYKLNKEYTLILLDDFIGSGNTIEEYFLKHIEPIKNNFKGIHFVGIAGMQDGFRRISPLFTKVNIPKSNIFKKAFSNDSSFFGYRNYAKYRELCYLYGKKLTKETVSKTGKIKFNDALGYENSQSLVSFGYGSPNNTLPIIWSNYDGWHPLIPRNSVDKMSIAKNFRKSILHELSILKEFGSEQIRDNFFSFKIKKGKREFSSVDKIDFSIYSIIKLSRTGFTPVSICQKLGVFYTDYENYINKGRERGIFDGKDELTLFGLELYQDAKKCINKCKKSIFYENDEQFKIKNINYTPSKFNGKS